MSINKILKGKTMTDEEFEELESKYEAERERRCKIEGATEEYYSIKRKMKDAFRECGGLEYIKNVKITFVKMSDRTGDGRGGMDEVKVEIPIENYEDFENCLNEYMNKQKEHIIELGGKIDD